MTNLVGTSPARAHKGLKCRSLNGVLPRKERGSDEVRKSSKGFNISSGGSQHPQSGSGSTSTSRTKMELSVHLTKLPRIVDRLVPLEQSYYVCVYRSWQESFAPLNLQESARPVRIVNNLNIDHFTRLLHEISPIFFSFFRFATQDSGRHNPRAVRSRDILHLSVHRQ